ncbi:MAG: hypothetical protein ABIW16_00745 [Sphingomicrobium sp.]
MSDPTTLERAFALARSGECINVEDIRRRLRTEHHDSVDAHLSGPSVRKQLLELCNAARARSD